MSDCESPTARIPRIWVLVASSMSCASTWWLMTSSRPTGMKTSSPTRSSGPQCRREVWTARSHTPRTLGRSAMARNPRLSAMAVEPDAREACARVAGGGLLRQARARGPLHDDLRRTGEAALHRGRPLGLGRGHRPGLSRRTAVHPRRLSVDVPRPALDDAPVRGVRHRRGDQRPLPLPARPRADRALHRLRHAHPDGPRLRRAPLARGGGRGGRRARHARRHDRPLLRDPARRGDHLDDDQRARRRSCSPSTSPRPRSRASPPTGSAARSRPTS